MRRIICEKEGKSRNEFVSGEEEQKLGKSRDEFATVSNENLLLILDYELRVLRMSNPRTLEPSNPRTLEPSNPRTLEPSNPRTLEPLHPMPFITYFQRNRWLK
ncbi:hypothetical protein C0W59_05365 [Photobacterium kishitanii]|nr:hypothetical protein C0W59_05365 [Photobacterium kishitanii]